MALSSISEQNVLYCACNQDLQTARQAELRNSCLFGKTNSWNDLLTNIGLSYVVTLLPSDDEVPDYIPGSAIRFFSSIELELEFFQS